MSAAPLLAVDGLSVSFHGTRVVRAVQGLSFTVERGETVALVGESGSGKSVTALSILRLIEREGGTIDSGSVRFTRRSGTVEDLAALPEPAMRAVRGDEISMIFQEPMTSLNPVLTIGHQVAEALRVHRPIGRREAEAAALDLLTRVRMSDPERRLSQHPHELSGGMRQRVMIAMALALKPLLVVADEPTTALDVTIQAEILDLMRAMQGETGAAVLFITHDMGVVAEIADHVVVMRHGERVEAAPTAQLFAAPAAAYTRELLAAVPKLGAGSPVLAAKASPLLEVNKLVVRFPVRQGPFRRLTGMVHAVEDVSFALRPGETLGLVGESGSGKSTIGRAVLRLVDPTSGTIALSETDVTHLSPDAMRPFRRNMQVIFQDPYASLNPRIPVVDLVTEPLAIHTGADRAERREVAAALVARVGLPADCLDRYAHQFSGGQRQRLAIARALSVRPRLIVADEAVSALDVSVQAQVLELLRELQAEEGLAYLFISHDIAVVEEMSHRVAVLEAGRIVEIGPTAAVLSAPAHPYTQALLAAVPVADPAARGHRPKRPEYVPRRPIHALGARPAPLRYTSVGPDHLAALG